jgi:hypothetical protein
MDRNGWRLLVAHTITGQVVDELPLVNVPTWARELNTAGQLDSVKISLYPQLADDTRQRLNEPYRWTLALVRDGWIAQAGPYYMAAPDEESRTASLSAMPMWEFLSRKRLAEYAGKEITAADADIVFKPDSADPANQNLTLHSVARRMVEISTTGSDQLALPIALPDPVAGTAEYTVAAADLKYIGDVLTELTGLDGGPEIEFSPEFGDSTQSYIRWRMRIGNTRLYQAGDPHAWDYGKAAQSFTVSVDGTDQTFYVFAKGQDARGGSGSGALTWAFTNITSHFGSDYALMGWPFLWTADTTHLSVTDTAAMQAVANQDVITHQYPVQTASVVVRLDGLDQQDRPTGSPRVEDVSVGDLGMVQVRDHSWLPDGQYGVRVLRMENGPDPFSARLTLQVLGVTS